MSVVVKALVELGHGLALTACLILWWLAVLGVVYGVYVLGAAGKLGLFLHLHGFI